MMTIEITPMEMALILGLIVLLAPSMWRTYAKAGQPGWACLIPIYGRYILLKIAGKPGWWLLLTFIPFVALFVRIDVVVDIADNFGRGWAFALGLFFLPFVFYPILAFGSAVYEPKIGDAVVYS